MTSQLPALIGNPLSADLVSQMRPALLQYFRRKTGSAAEAEDLTQDVLIRALTHVRWRTPGEAKGYIFRIAINRWRDRCRRLRAHGTKVDLDVAVIEHTAVERPPECALMEKEELYQLTMALGKLSERTRTILMLIKLEQIKIATVAEMLGISVSAVNKHLAKGLESLARMRITEGGS